METSLTNFLSFTKRLIYPALRNDAILVDFTMGNGYDTLFLAKSAPQGMVYAFDVQQAALDSTARRLSESGVNNAKLILDGHENLDKYVPDTIDGGLFNLGWLPGSDDKTVTTHHSTTSDALQKSLARLKVGGIIVVAVYPGHAEGAREGEQLQMWAATLDRYEFDVLLHRLINVPECQYLIAFQRKRERK